MLCKNKNMYSIIYLSEIMIKKSINIEIIQSHRIKRLRSKPGPVFHLIYNLGPSLPLSGWDWVLLRPGLAQSKTYLKHLKNMKHGCNDQQCHPYISIPTRRLLIYSTSRGLWAHTGTHPWPCRAGQKPT